MKHKNCQQLYTYWDSVRAGRPAPRRFDIEPGRLGSVLPDTFILERTPSGALIYRLAGTRLADGLGIDLRGRNFLDGLTPADAQKLKPQIEQVVSQAAVLEHTIEIENSVGAKGTVEVLLLPLTHTRDTIDRFLGCIVWLDEPLNLKEHKISKKRLVSSKVVWPLGTAEPAPVATLRPSHADRQIPFLPHVRNARIVRQDRRQFRVYDGGLGKPPGDDI